MSKRIKKTVIISLFIACVCTLSVFAANYEPFSSVKFQSHDASLIAGSSQAILCFHVGTENVHSRLGISAYTLHDQTTGAKTPKTINNFISDNDYSGRMTIQNLTSGHTYYLTVTFYADGSTYSQVTNSVRIQCQTGTGKSCACSFS